MEDITKLPGYVRVEVWGDRALFTRPELKLERFSYGCITPSAARAVLQSVYWHPFFDWEIRRITVLNKIKRDTMTCNELDFKIPSGKVKTAMKLTANAKPAPQLCVPRSASRQQRLSNFLVDVHYIIEAVIVPAAYNKTGEPFLLDKAMEIFTKRMNRGASFHTPYLGMREFPAHVARHRYKDKKSVSHYKGMVVDMGIMFYDYDYTDTSFSNGPRPYFFNPHMNDGVIEIPRREEVFGHAVGGAG